MPAPLFLLGLGLAAGVKLLYDACTDDSSSSSTTSSYSGPSREELQRRELETLYSDFQKEFREFWQKEDQLLCLKGESALLEYLHLSFAVLENKLSPREAFEQRKALEMDKASAANAMVINNVEEFLSEKFFDCERMIDHVDDVHYMGVLLAKTFDYERRMAERINAALPVWTDSIRGTKRILGENEEPPRMAFAGAYDLHRDLYLLPKLASAYSPERVEALEDLPGDWNRVTPELARRWKDVQDFEAATAEGGEPRVVVCGMLKAGKSSLLNSLFDDPSNQHFPTARNRKTMTNQSEVRNGICFIDTPGLDYNNKDTEEAKAAYAGADLLLFVHNGSKELEEGQLVFLRELHDMHDDLEDRIFFVITSKEESGAELEALKDKISEKVMERCAFSPEIFAVENTSYRSDKEKVRASSGITELRSAIEEFCADVAAELEDLREERRARVLHALKDAVVDVVKAIWEDSKKYIISRFRICSAFVKMVENKKIQVDRVRS